jgi:hypothetical protein
MCRSGERTSVFFSSPSRHNQESGSKPVSLVDRSVRESFDPQILSASAIPPPCTLRETKVQLLFEFSCGLVLGILHFSFAIQCTGCGERREMDFDLPNAKRYLPSPFPASQSISLSIHDPQLTPPKSPPLRSPLSVIIPRTGSRRPHTRITTADEACSAVRPHLPLFRPR